MAFATSLLNAATKDEELKENTKGSIEPNLTQQIICETNAETDTQNDTDDNGMLIK